MVAAADTWMEHQAIAEPDRLSALFALGSGAV
jgi:hypothetical protein